MNVHKRCAKNVAPNCGIDRNKLADMLAEIGYSPDSLTQTTSKKSKRHMPGTPLQPASLVSLPYATLPHSIFHRFDYDVKSIFSKMFNFVLSNNFSASEEI